MRASAVNLVESGYKGNNSDSLIVNLLRAVNFDAEEAHRGIIFVDELDKCRRAEGLDRDVSGEGAQQGLLGLMDGGITTVDADRQGKHTIDTSRILFVCGGAFVGLTDIVRERLAQGEPLGFRPPSRAAQDGRLLSDETVLAHLTEQDLHEYGLIPELIGRFARFSCCHHLGISDMVHIFDEARDPGNIS